MGMKAGELRGGKEGGAGPEPRAPASERALRWAIYLTMRVLALTLRYRSEGMSEVAARLERGDRLVLALWHETISLAVPFFEGYPIPVLVSESRDGERVAWIAAAFGHRPVRGSSSRGGVRGLLELVRRIRAGERFAAHFVDGPRGPARVVKPGLLTLAQRSRSWIVPATFVAERALRTGSWDRQQIPGPFSRVAVRLGPPIEVAPELDDAALEALRKQVEQRLLDDFAALSAGGPVGDRRPGPALHVARGAR